MPGRMFARHRSPPLAGHLVRGRASRPTAQWCSNFAPTRMIPGDAIAFRLQIAEDEAAAADEAAVWSCTSCAVHTSATRVPALRRKSSYRSLLASVTKLVMVL